MIMNDRKKIYKIIVIAIFMMIIISVLIPLFLDIFIFGNKFPSNISNSDWSGFLGSFLGGILGSVGSLIGICITIFESRNMQNDTQKQKEIQMHKEKLDSIIQYSSMFWKEIRCMQNKISNILQNKNKISEIKEEIKKIEVELHEKTRIEEKQKIALLNKKEEYNREILILREQHISEVDVDYSDLTYAYFMLKIILKDIQIAQNYCFSIENTYEKMYQFSSIDTVIEENLNISMNFIEKLNSEFYRFIDEYSKKYILIDNY